MDGLATRLSWRRLPWLAEILSILAFYGVYMGIRFITPNRIGEAFEHASEVTSVESTLGVYHELAVNHFAARHHGLAVFATYYYVTLHYVVTTLVLVWLWRSRHRAYAPLRSALVFASAIALVLYAAWPLAPPRFAMTGAVDTVDDVLSQGHGVSSLVNQIAAMPSMHVGWALWCAVVVVTTVRTRWRHLAWLYPIVTTAVVVLTANHYLLDAVGGVVVVGVPLYLCGVRLHRLVLPAPRPVAKLPERCAA